MGTNLIVNGITPDLKILGPEQNFIFPSIGSSGAMKLINSFSPTTLLNSESALGFLNYKNVGLRFRHISNSGSTFGDFVFEKFGASQQELNAKIFSYSEQTDKITFFSSAVFDGGISLPIVLTGDVTGSGTTDAPIQTTFTKTLNEIDINGDLDLQNFAINNLKSPESINDAVTMGYVDDHTWLSTDITDFNTAVANIITPYNYPTKAYVDNHTWLSTSITDLETTVKSYSLDSFAIPMLDLNLNSQKITNLEAGTATNDAINLGQLGALGLSNLTTNGFLIRTAVNTYINRTLEVGSNLTINNANGVSGNPSINLSTTPIVTRITINNSPTTSTDGVTKGYVDQYVDAIVAGIDFKNPCNCATVSNLTASYVNGTGGVGASLVNSSTLVALVIDGYTLNLGDRVLVKNQTNQYQNGIYQVSVKGSATVPWALTRATDYDDISSISPGNMVAIESGTSNINTTWLQTATITTIGTSPIIFTQFSYGASSFLQVGNNLSDLSNITTARSNLGLANAITSLSGVAQQITISGTSTAPIVGLVNNTVIPGNAAMTLPVGTTAQRPTGVLGNIRGNSTLDIIEGYYSSSWRDMTTVTLSGAITGTGKVGSTISTSLAPFTSALDLNNKKIKNLSDGTLDTDGCTVGQLNTAITNTEIPGLSSGPNATGFLVRLSSNGDIVGRWLVGSPGVVISNNTGEDLSPQIILEDVPISTLDGFPNDTTKYLRGDGDWNNPLVQTVNSNFNILINNTNLSSTTTGLKIQEDGLNAIQFGYNNSTNEGYVWAENNASLKLGTNGTSRLTISSSGLIDVKTNRITNLGTPTSSTDAATKSYVDSLQQYNITARVNGTDLTNSQSNLLMVSYDVTSNITSGTITTIALPTAPNLYKLLSIMIFGPADTNGIRSTPGYSSNGTQGGVVGNSLKIRVDNATIQAGSTITAQLLYF